MSVEGEGTLLTTEASGADQAAADEQPSNDDISPFGEQAKGEEVAKKADASDTPDDKGEGDEGDGDKAPIEYADFKIPEGVTVDPKDVTAFEGLAKDMGLSQDNAQKLLTFEAERIRQINDDMSEQHYQTVQEWAEKAQADKEFGGEAFQENITLAAKAVDAFGSPEVVEMLNHTGLGSHPEFIRMFVNIGKAVSSDGVITGGNGGRATDDAKAFFPNSDHN